MPPIADVVVDLQYGDCGKGKVVHTLAKLGSYSLVVRYNGGSNAGHTIFHNGKKFVTHLVPAGVFHEIPSLIGGGCVVDVDKFLSEIGSLEAAGIEASRFVRIANNAHIVCSEHIKEESSEKRIGTTRTGNGPAYRDKHARTGLRAMDEKRISKFLVDPYDVIWSRNHDRKVILMEGAQGFGLDIDWGDYPYVSSSSCTVSAAVNAGIPPQNIHQIIGVAKPYETYVGSKKFGGDHPALHQIQKVGDEFGATTGRPRQCNWMNLDNLVRAANVNGVTRLIFNKADIMREVGVYRLIVDDKTVDFEGENEFKVYVEKFLKKSCPNIWTISWSESPETI